MNESIEDQVKRLSNNYKEVIPKDVLVKYPKLMWGGNGVGDRWANKKFNYTAIYSKKNGKTKCYSENDDDVVPQDKLVGFLETSSGNGIIGIYVHSKRLFVQQRPINKAIRNSIISNCCVCCGSNSEMVCDHKNDLYNDNRVLDATTQLDTDFQPLCNGCNLRKRQACKKERETKKIYSAKEIPMFASWTCFPWEKKHFDINDVNCKNDTFWFDPVEFNNKIKKYNAYVVPILNEIKSSAV